MPQAAAVAAIARRLGLSGLSIATVSGDDVLDAVVAGDYVVSETGEPVAAFGDRLLSANAYIGAEPLIQALGGGADVVITGRAADPALFVAPLVHEFGWSLDDWTALGRGTLVGHMLECAGQVTGGYFADPGCKDVDGLSDLGFPIAEVPGEGPFVITKLAGSGGAVTPATCKEQLLYEIHDPAAYVTPDVVADFSRVRVTELAQDRVALDGAGGRPRPETLKVSLGFRDGYIGEGQISYAGAGAVGSRATGGADCRGAARESGLRRRRRPIRCDRHQRAARQPISTVSRSPTRCASALPREHARRPRRRRSATKSKRSTPTAPRAAAERPRWSARSCPSLRRSCRDRLVSCTIHREVV